MPFGDLAMWPGGQWQRVKVPDPPGVGRVQPKARRHQDVRLGNHVKTFM